MNQDWKETLIQWSKVALAAASILGVIGTLWLTLRLPTPAWSEDVTREFKNVNRETAEVANEVYQQKKDSLTILQGQIQQQPPSLFREQQEQAIQRQLHDADRKQKAAEERVIELSK